jgi:Aspartyl protease/PDZ domain
LAANFAAIPKRRERWVVLALLVLGATTLSAAQPQDVLAAARAATGISDGSDRGFVTLSGTKSASGLSGHWSQTVDLATGRSREAADFGVYSTAAVWDGHHYWRQDASGGVHPINSAYMQAVHVTDGWLAARGYLERHALGAKLEPLEDQAADGRRFAVLRATPRQGQPVDLWFDKESKQLARTVQLMTTYVWTVRYDDYRRAAGLVLPFRITADDGDVSEADVIQIERVDRARPTKDAFSRLRPPDDVTVAAGKTAVPIEFDGDVIVEAKLNGQGPFAFILDTGGHDILTPAAADALGLKPVGAGSSGGSGAGTLPEQYARVDRVDIGGMRMRNPLFSVIPLQFDTLERGARPPLAGILGLELFERCVVRLNYRDRTLSFERASDDRHQGAGTAVPIVFTDHEPLLSAKIDGVSGDVGVDTGNSGALVIQGIWADAHGLKDKYRSGLPVQSFGSGGASSNWSTRADFEIAGQHFPRVIALYAADQKGSFSSRTESGNVGNEILAHFILDFDYVHGQLWFEPAPGYTPPSFSRAGVSVYKETADAFKVATVSPGTPAAEAGLQADDEIVAVDGIASSQLSGWDFRRAVRRAPGTTLTLAIIRDGHPQTAVLTLRELLP